MCFPKKPKNHLLFVTNNKVKKNCSKLILSEEDYEIADILINAFDNMAEDSFFYRTPSSQIFKYNSKDLNCNRHLFWVNGCPAFQSSIWMSFSGTQNSLTFTIIFTVHNSLKY